MTGDRIRKNEKDIFSRGRVDDSDVTGEGMRKSDSECSSQKKNKVR